MTNPTLALIPSAYKASKVYSVLPSNGDGDFTFTRNSFATRVNSNGLIESVGVNIPRLDYSDGNCPSLLLEPQRTNLFTYSEDFSQGIWLNYGETSVTLDNTEANPYGNLGSYKITGTSGSGRFGTILSVIPSTNYTLSFYAKNIDASLLKLFFTNVTGFSSVIYTNDVNQDSWSRVEINFTSNTGTSCVVQITRDLPVGDSIYLWGLQAEQGSYATSYIPTNGSIATRIVETCNNAGNASTFNDSEGVLFIEASALVAGSNSQITLSDGTNNNVIILRFDTSVNRLSLFIRGNGGAYAIDFIEGVTQTDNNKIALVWDATNLKIWLNGVEANTVGVNDLPIGLNKLNLSDATGTSNFFGKVKQVQYFDTALTDTELQELTTL